MLNDSEQFVTDHILDIGGLPAIDEAVKLINSYMRKCYYKSKNARLFNWWDTNPNIQEIVISIITVALVHKTMPYQAICGILNHKIKLKQERDRVITIAEIIAIVATVDLIHVIKQGKGNDILIKPGFSIDEDIPSEDKHELGFYKPQRVVANKDIIQGSMILGSKLNHHEKPICLDHINRMNSIPLTLNTGFMKQADETPTFVLDTPQKKAQWLNFKKEGLYYYMKLLKKGSNRLFLGHKYDSRGRSYACGYYITTQGTSFKKASLELYNKELVRSEL